MENDSAALQICYLSLPFYLLVSFTVHSLPPLRHTLLNFYVKVIIIFKIDLASPITSYLIHTYVVCFGIFYFNPAPTAYAAIYTVGSKWYHKWNQWPQKPTIWYPYCVFWYFLSWPPHHLRTYSNFHCRIRMISKMKSAAAKMYYLIPIL